MLVYESVLFSYIPGLTGDNNYCKSLVIICMGMSFKHDFRCVS